MPDDYFSRLAQDAPPESGSSSGVLRIIGGLLVLIGIIGVVAGIIDLATPCVDTSLPGTFSMQCYGDGMAIVLFGAPGVILLLIGVTMLLASMGKRTSTAPPRFDGRRGMFVGDAARVKGCLITVLSTDTTSALVTIDGEEYRFGAGETLVVGAISLALENRLVIVGPAPRGFAE